MDGTVIEDRGGSSEAERGLQPYTSEDVPELFNISYLPTNISIFTNATNCSGMRDYESSIPLAEFLPVLLVYGMTLIFGVTGNLLVIFIIARYRRMRSATNVFLTSLATADLLLVILCVPIKFAKFFSFTWEYGEFLCKTVHYMQNVSVICSVLTLTTMSVERYYAIVHPLRARYSFTTSRTRRVIAALWLTSFLLAVPILFGQVHRLMGNDCVQGYWCYKEWSAPAEEKAYEVGMLLLILVLPLSVMSYTYTSISIELRHVATTRLSLRASSHALTSYDSESRDKTLTQTDSISSYQAVRYAAGRVFRRRSKSSSEDDSTREQVIKMLVTIIVIFAICWSPYLVDNVLVAFGVLHRLNYGYLKYMRQAFSLMAYFNSCVNPWVYAFMSKNFRERFHFALCTWKAPVRKR